METNNEPQNKGEREVGKAMPEQTANIAFVYSPKGWGFAEGIPKRVSFPLGRISILVLYHLNGIIKLYLGS